jgi:hypothetical protein
MKYFYMIWASAIALLYSCSTKNSNNETEIHTKMIWVSQAESISSEDIFILKKTIYLDFCDACIIGEIDKMLVDESGIYVSDKNLAKSVKKFDFDGKLIYSIDAAGDGLGKYVLPFDFGITDDNLLILDVNQRKFLRFDKKSGEYLNEVRIGHYQINKFAILAEDMYAYHLDGRGLPPGLQKVSAIVAGETEVSGAMYVWDYGNTDFMTVEQEFTKTSHAVLFAKSMNDTIYSVTPNGFVPKYFLDFGDKSIGPEIKQMEMMEAMQTIMRDWPHFHWGRFFENQSKAVFIWSGNLGKKNLSVFDKKDERVYNLADEKFFPKNIFYLDDQRMMAYVTPEEYMDEDIQGLIQEYRNPVILLFEFKR